MERDEKLVHGIVNGDPYTHVSLRGGFNANEKKSYEGEVRTCTLFPPCGISYLSRRSFLHLLRAERIMKINVAGSVCDLFIVSIPYFQLLYIYYE